MTCSEAVLAGAAYQPPSGSWKHSPGGGCPALRSIQLAKTPRNSGAFQRTVSTVISFAYVSSALDGVAPDWPIAFFVSGVNVHRCVLGDDRGINRLLGGYHGVSTLAARRSASCHHLCCRRLGG